MGSAALMQTYVETLVPRTQNPSFLDIRGADITDHLINLFHDKQEAIASYFISDTIHAPMYYS